MTPKKILTHNIYLRSAFVDVFLLVVRFTETVSDILVPEFSSSEYRGRQYVESVQEGWKGLFVHCDLRILGWEADMTPITCLTQC